MVFHYIDENYCAKSVLVALPRLNGAHTGENLAEVIVKVLKDYDISDNIGYFIADNNSTNDKAIRLIINEIRPDLNPVQRRVRCVGHILNLAC